MSILQENDFSRRVQELIDTYIYEVSSPDCCQSPMVSVASVAFNHRHYISQSLESILAQETNFPYEIVISDDCSTDGTTDILRDYQVRYPRKIRLILAKRNLWNALPGMATSPTCNIAILGACRGKYIAPCEGDDYWTDPLKLQKQVDFLEANPDYSGAAHLTQVLEVDGTLGDPLRWWQSPDNQLDVTLEDTISNTPPFHTSSFVFRRSLLKLPTDACRIASGDMMLYCLISSHGKVRRFPEYMSMYRKHSGGVTNTAAHRGGLLHSLNRLFLFSTLRLFLYPQGYTRFSIVIKNLEVLVIRDLARQFPTRIFFKDLKQVLKTLSLSQGAKIFLRVIPQLPYQLVRYVYRKLASIMPTNMKDSIRSRF